MLTSKALAPQLLIQQCIAGKRAAQIQLYETYSPTMFGICLRYASDYHSAEDLLQEGFIKAFNNIDRFKGMGSFEGWLKRIFINTAIEQYRKNKRLSFLPLEREQQVNSQETNALDNLAVQDLLKLLQKTPYGYRTVFNLYAVEGYNHREIGDLLGISQGTSKSQLARARTFIKKLLKEQN
ncbi:MAG: RNA polymerase sigma factor [Saprospiraceae bacterium]